MPFSSHRDLDTRLRMNVARLWTSIVAFSTRMDKMERERFCATKPLWIDEIDNRLSLLLVVVA